MIYLRWVREPSSLTRGALALALAACGALAHTGAAAAEDAFPIDLPTALRLAKAQNYAIALAGERIAEAQARLEHAKVMLLPTLTVGASYQRQDGQLQATGGEAGDVDRTAGFSGLGAGAVGSGTTRIPGLAISADLGAAYFEPLAAKQYARAAKAASRVETNAILRDVAVLYYELVRAKAALAIAEEVRARAQDLATLTRRFSETGQGLASDAERAAVELLLRDSALVEAREALHIQSIHLAELLHLDAQIQLDPADAAAVPVQVVSPDRELNDLVQTALRNHPTTEQRQAMADLAEHRLRQAKYGPFIPSVALTFSAGSFSGESGPSLGDSGGRHEYGAMLYWQLDNLGFGDRARTRQRRSEFRRAELERAKAADRLAAEVTQAHAQVAAREKRIALGKAAVERALRSYDLNWTRIYEIQGLPIEALQASQSLAATRMLYLDSVIEYNQAQFRLFAALGEPAGAAPAPRH